MSTFVTKEPRVGMQPIATVDTTQRHPLGTRVKASDNAATAYGEGEFIYLKGVANTVLGSWVTYNLDDGTTALTVADAIGPVAVAMGICDAATKFGWYQIFGKAVGKVLAAFADNGLPYLTATAGSLDDAAVIGDYVHNAKGASAIDTPSTGLAEFEIEYPFVDNDTDDST